MTTITQTPADADFTFEPLNPAQLAGATPHALAWLWDGYLAPGKITTLISAPKTGKTTLVARLLARTTAGGQLAGRAVVVSEESPDDWDARCRQLAIGPNVQFVCRPFKRRPTDAQWLTLIAHLEALHRQQALDLIVLDALAALLPGYAETNAPKLLECLMPLQELARLGPAFWILHHPTKAPRPDGQTARGSGALPGFADIVLEMQSCRRPRSDDRRRRLCAYSRYAATPRQLIIELTADGLDYALAAHAPRAEGLADWPTLHRLLSRSYRKMSIKDVLDFWPSDEERPDRKTLSRWLQRAHKAGELCQTGAGHCGDGHVYWVPGRED